jgi:glycosyltransferase involved in cell wall biosynthesis
MPSPKGKSGMATLISNFDANSVKPRVLISGHLPPPIGGIATYFLALLNSPLPELVDLSFVQTSSQKRNLSSSGRFTLKNLLSAFLDCARFTRTLLISRPRVAHISTAFGFSFLKHSVCIWIARVAGCQILLHPRCSITVLYLDRPKLWKWYFRLVVRQTSGVIALSREWEQLESIVPSCRIFFLPNAIDQSPYKEIARIHLEQNRESAPIKILYLGYVGKDKGSFDLVEAAKILKSTGEKAHIDIVGDDLREGERDALIKQAHEDELEDYLQIHTAAYGEDKLAFFRDADIFVYPSYHEGLPNAVMEAMACALPIVATKVGGIPDQVMDGENGILVKPREPAQLAKALAKLSKDKALRREMQVKSYQIAIERYDMNSYISKLVDVYKIVSEEP